MQKGRRPDSERRPFHMLSCSLTTRHSRAEQLPHPVRPDREEQRGQARPGLAADEELVEQGEEGALGELQLGCGLGFGVEATRTFGTP